MKKLLTIIVTLCVCSSAYAVDFFFQKDVGYWLVVGHPGDKEKNLNPACIATTTWKDGSYLNLVQDLSDGELLLEIKNNEWNVTDIDLDSEYKMDINVYNSRKTDAQTWPAKFKFISKNAITIRGLDYKTFLPAFMNYYKMVFIMPGTVTNAEVQLVNSTNAIGLMTECMDASKMKKFDTTPNNESIQKQGV